jgi:molybdopterin-binding protein
MKISARNFLEGKIKEVHKGATTAHVEIELKGGETVISSITNEAVRSSVSKAPKPTRSSKPPT